MTEIKTEVGKEEIGRLFIDEWANKKVRFHDFRKDTQQILHRKTFDEKLRKENWFVEFIETPSDNYEVVYEENVSHLCSRCEQDAMFDSDNNEFYCPGCGE